MVKFPIPPTIKQFATRFSEAGFSIYIVGGAVRDYYAGYSSHDYDFATDALPNEVMALFPKVIPTGIKHGTVTVLFRDEMLEVTTFRVDGEYHDSRRPSTTTFVRSLEEDLKRRDFTINALAIEVSSGKLIDFHHGIQDIKAKTIRAIGDPVQRFTEDALRIMRACRIGAQLQFGIEEATQKAMQTLSENLALVSGERIRSELFNLLDSPVPSIGLFALHECHALSVILPELAAGNNIMQKGNHQHDIMRHNIYACDAAPRNKPLVRLAALLHDIGKVAVRKEQSDGEVSFYQHEFHSEKMAIEIMERLKCSNAEKNTVANLIRNHMFHYNEDWSDGAVRRFINRVGLEALEDLFDLRLADQTAIYGRAYPESLHALKDHIERVLKASSALKIKDLAVDGNDLATLSIPRGPIMGLVLQELLDTVLDDPQQNQRETLLKIAKQFYEQRINIEKS